MTGPNSSYFCDAAVVDGIVERDVLVQVLDGRLTRVEPRAPAGPDATHLEGLTIAGMANAHSHAFHRALRSRTQADRGSFWTWRDLMYEAASLLDPDNYFRLARATYAEMAMAGISCVGEFHYVHHQPDGTPYANPNELGDALLAAAAEAGIRITLLDTLYLHGGLSANGYESQNHRQQRFCDDDFDAWAERVDMVNVGPNQRLGAAIHSVRAVDPDSAHRLAQWATAQTVAPLHAHVSEQRAENEQCLAHHGTTPVGLLDRSSCLNGRFTAVHATHLTDADISTMGASGATVCLCPTTERDLADGIGPTRDLAAHSVPLCLGSDSHAVIDMLEESRAVELDERLASEGRGTHSAGELLAMATSAGHVSLGFDDAGNITVGNRADLVTIDLNSVRTAGSSPEGGIETAIFAATAADVRHVVVDGKVIVADGRHLGLDVPGELASAISAILDR